MGLRQHWGWFVIVIIIVSFLIPGILIVAPALLGFEMERILQNIEASENVWFFFSASLLTITVLIYSLRSTYLQNARMLKVTVDIQERYKLSERYDYKSNKFNRNIKEVHKERVNDFKERSKDFLFASALCFLSSSLFFTRGAFSDVICLIGAFSVAFFAVLTIVCRPLSNEKSRICLLNICFNIYLYNIIPEKYHWLLPGDPWGDC